MQIYEKNPIFARKNGAIRRQIKTILPQNQLICRYISGDFARQRTPNHEKHSGEVQEGADSPCLQLGKGIHEL